MRGSARRPLPASRVEAIQRGGGARMLDARVATLRDRGWESLRPLAGRVVRSYFGGRVQEITDDDAEFSEIYGPSGALYHLTTSAWWWHAEGEDLTIESEIQEDGPPGGSLCTSFRLARDGTFTLEY